MRRHSNRARLKGARYRNCDAPGSRAPQVTEVLRPAQQLQLDEKQLCEEVTRTLAAARPGPLRQTVRYNLEECSFRPEPQLEQVVVHYSCVGTLLHVDSEEGQQQAGQSTAEVHIT